MAHLLSESQLEQFNTEGFVVVNDFFSAEELQPVIDAITVLVGELADDLFAAGKIKDKCENEGFYTRLSKLEEQFKGAAVLLHKKGKLPLELATLWSNPRLLDVIEQLIGPEIAGHPVWNLRTKTPNNPSVTVPWHQDAAYLSGASDTTMQPTAWIPLIDAVAETGCMEVMRYGHQAGIVAPHECCTGPTWYIQIPEDKIKPTLGQHLEQVICEVPFGGFLLINQLIPHRSLENLSKRIRWSVDLRWQRPDLPHGFFGVKDPILIRSAKEPNHRPDWASWGAVDRHTKSAETLNFKWDEDRFSTVISGPWMKRWPITSHNAHTAAFNADSEDISGWHKS
eukprot:TRINITY_DN4408_c0_g1_i1.p1 TRINITY_DN4408_c0_g1~~TRINITY_DN4408_c0_g1_i1.p1  ORF type:complete len:339 (-),score=89.76 TRINITY_DN4408_c0_g1_i1:83-1099(-)